ncbi:melatonin receptor type 1A-like [Amphiura filiformis]|uniref:melatonin receptor type 1A-like n=1 Tax=Amphiura filiformis TaxID=82378 RepID=UPI003B2162C0
MEEENVKNTTITMATRGMTRTLNSSDSAKSDQSLLDSQLPILYTYITLMIFTSLVGTVGNIVVIVAVVTSKKLRVLQNVFIINLAVADLLVTALVNPFAVIGALDMGKLFYRLPALCEFIATMVVTSCGCSIWSISAVSVNRYIYICHRVIYSKIYNQRTLPFMVIGLWLIAFLLDLPNYLGWGDHIFDTRQLLCNYDYSYNLSYTRYHLIALGVIVPVCVLCYSYFRIFMTFRSSSRRMRQHATNPSSSQKEKPQTADRRVLKTVAIICIVFLVMWTPYSIIVVFDLHYQFWWFLLASFMAFTNSSVNFLVYAIDRNFRQAYSDIWKRIVSRCDCLVTKSDAIVTTGRKKTGSDVNDEITESSGNTNVAFESSMTSNVTSNYL